MMNENVRDSVDNEFISSQGWRKELERTSSSVKSKFPPAKQRLGRWVWVARTP